VLTPRAGVVYTVFHMCGKPVENYVENLWKTCGKPVENSVENKRKKKKRKKVR
jgi:hypothetical protein